MSNNEYNRRENKPGLPPKSPRGNYQTWIILATLGFILLLMYFGNSGELPSITRSEFENMIESRDVKRVVLVKNMDLVEVTLTGDALNNSKYRERLEKAAALASTRTARTSK